MMRWQWVVFRYVNGGGVAVMLLNWVADGSCIGVSGVGVVCVAQVLLDDAAAALRGVSAQRMAAVATLFRQSRDDQNAVLDGDNAWRAGLRSGREIQTEDVAQPLQVCDYVCVQGEGMFICTCDVCRWC